MQWATGATVLPGNKECLLVELKQHELEGHSVGFPVSAACVDEPISACRCTALEQERDRLKEKVSELSATVADASDTKTQLKQQLKTSTADRDEAVRHNLKLQSKLSSLEEDYAGLQQVNQEAVRQLEESKAQVDRLTKEAGQLTALVEKLEGRYVIRH